MVNVEMEQLLCEVIKVVAESMADSNRIASGNTIKAMTVDIIDDYHGRVLVPSHFRYVERGAAPTRRGATPWPERYKVIHEWAKQKGIISDDSVASRRISGAIATSIKKYGTKAWRMGGDDVFTSRLDELFEEHINMIVTNYIRLE